MPLDAFETPLQPTSAYWSFPETPTETPRNRSETLWNLFEAPKKRPRSPRSPRGSPCACKSLETLRNPGAFNKSHRLRGGRGRGWPKSTLHTNFLMIWMDKSLYYSFRIRKGRERCSEKPKFWYSLDSPLKLLLNYASSTFRGERQIAGVFTKSPWVV